MPLVFGAQGVTPSSRGQATTVITLAASEVQLIPPGNWTVRTGRYSTVQEFDPVPGIWRSIGGDWPSASMQYVNSDGVNFRIANQTGCAVGALITNAGTLYTSAPVVTAASGASIWQAIVGGAVSTSVTVTNGGTGYVYPPAVEFAMPPSPGIQATGFCTISGGVVTSVTVTDQGAGYTSPPVISFINDPREGLNALGSGSGASAVCILTGAQTVTGLVAVDHGTALTSVPVLTFTGGGGSAAAATAIMCWAMTAFGVSAAGSGYSGQVEVSALGGFPTTAAAYTNPTTQSALVRPRKASILATLSSGGLSGALQSVIDGGIYAGNPAAIIYATPGTTVPVTSVVFPTMGGVTDTVLLIAA